MRNVLFYERQSASRVLFALALLIGLVGLVMLIPSSDETRPLVPARGFAGFVMLVLAVVGLNVLTITTWVYDEEIRIQYGRVIPWHNTRIKFEDLKYAAVVETETIQADGGWRIHTGEYDGLLTTIMNTGSEQAVHLKAGDRSYLLGTRYPEKLLECIRTARESHGDGE